MNRTYRENVSIGDSRKFGEDILDPIINWIEGNLKPNEVFSEETLILWMKDTYSPEDIFTYDQLDEWANQNYDMEGKRG